MNSAELFFNIVDYDILMNIVDDKKITINGFKNYARAPETIVRKSILIKYLGKSKAYKMLLEEICTSKVNEIRKDSLEEFLYSLLSYPLRGKVKNYEALGMLMLYYPDYAEKMVDKFNFNIKNNKYIFEGCLEIPELSEDNCYEVMERILQLKNGIEWVESSTADVEKKIKTIDKIDDYKRLSEMLRGIDFLDFSLQFKQLRKNYPDYLILIAFVNSNIESIKGSEAYEKEFYNKLLFNAYGCLCMESFGSLENELLREKETINDLKGNIKECEKKLYLSESNLRNMEKKILNSKSKIELSSKKKEERIYERDSFKIKQDNKYDFIIITNFNDEKLFNVIGICYILHPQKINILEMLLNNFKGTVFIERNCINTTKELIKIEKLIKRSNNKSVVLLSNSLEELVRNIIIRLSRLETGGLIDV